MSTVKQIRCALCRHCTRLQLPTTSNASCIVVEADAWSELFFKGHLFSCTAIRVLGPLIATISFHASICRDRLSTVIRVGCRAAILHAFKMAQLANLAKIYESKYRCDALVVFTTKPTAVRQAVSKHMQQVEAARAQEVRAEQPAAKKRRTSRGSAKAAAAGQQEEGQADQAPCAAMQPAWPEGCTILQAHTLQLGAASNLFFQQLNGDAAACARDKNLRVLGQSSRC